MKIFKWMKIQNENAYSILKLSLVKILKELKACNCTDESLYKECIIAVIVIYLENSFIIL